MTTWVQIQTEIQNWIALLAKQPVGAVCWADMGRPVADPVIIINVSSSQDVIAHENVAIVNDVTTRTIDIHRTMTLQVRVETSVESGRVSALETLELIRARSYMQHLRGWLINVTGVQVVKMPSDIVNVSYDYQQSRIHARSFDMFLTAHFSTQDVDPSYGEFNSVELGGTASIDGGTINLPSHYVP